MGVRGIIIIIDTALPFVLKISSKHVLSHGRALALALHNCNGVIYKWQLHYLDDLIFVCCRPQELECTETLTTALDTCLELELGVPVVQNNAEGPATALIFLGIQVDTCARELSLPQPNS